MAFDSIRVRVNNLTPKTDPKQSSKKSSVKTDSSSVASVAVQPSEEPTPALVPVLVQSSDESSAQPESSAMPVPAQPCEESSEPSEPPSVKPETSFSKTCVQDESSVSKPVSVPASTQPFSDVPQQLKRSEDAPRSLKNEPDLWLRAYTVLQEQQPELMKAYNTHLASLQHDQEHGSGILNERSVKFVLWFDPIVKNAVSTQPYAALAWSGASLLLPALVICHLSKKQRSRAWDDMTKSIDWVAKITEISKLSDDYSKLIDRYEATEISDIRDSELEQLNYSRRILEDLRDLVEATSKQSQANNQDQYERALLQDFAPRDGGWEDHKNINPTKVKDTCEWFFKDERFRKWRNTNTSTVLWVSASPGCGKSVLSRALIDEQHLYRSVATTVCYFFFKDGAESRMHATDALSAILHQLFEHDTENHLIKFALPSHRAHGHKLSTNFSELWQILLKCVESPTTGDIVVLLDALDECKSESWKSLLEKLVEFYSQRPSDQPSKLKFLITSRPYDDIELHFRRFLKASTYFAFDADENSGEIGKDIDKVIDAKMENDTIFEEKDRLSIAKRLKSMEQRTYLWLHLTFNIIQESPSSFEQWADLEELLSSLPKKVSEAYEKILSRSKDEKHTEALLRIMLAATRPLTLGEANRALTLALKPNKCGSYTELVSRCWREETFQQKRENFLIHRPQQGEWGGRLEMSSAHAEMAHVCLRYLSCLDESELAFIEETRKTCEIRGKPKSRISREIGEKIDRKLPLALYSAQHWMEHGKHSEDEKHIQDRIMDFLLPQGLSYFVWGRLFDPEDPWDRTTFTYYQQKSSLYYASFGGLQNTVSLLLQQQLHVNAEEGVLDKALNVASKNGHIDIVQLLIGKGADVNAQNFFGVSAIEAASAHGHIDLVQLLIEKGADVNAQTSFGGSAIEAASTEGHIDIVRLLIGKGADVNAQTSSGVSAIEAASADGHIDIVQLLIGKGADVNAQNYSGVIWLYSSLSASKKNALQFLLENGAYVNSAGERLEGNNALIAASERGYEDIVQLLLDNGAGVNSNDGCYNALFRAADWGNIESVQLLFDYGANFGLPNNLPEQDLPLHPIGEYYSNSLDAASRHGHEGIVQLLLEKGAIWADGSSRPDFSADDSSVHDGGSP
ncbi:uncharacterized protein N7446_000991 [Penicillium canescens]|uniref:uncharacterized protein n=1 Tax=Penicillium canescens TaxID=5083 RepID=UPI0026E02847|nr:uncharacterized protein N7446_000991 [Penicillium canescens]KAJ6078055.1 hypothetical protein N7446_000991 [Penicillium canescens]